MVTQTFSNGLTDHLSRYCQHTTTHAPMFVQCREVGVSAPSTQVHERIGHSYLRVRSKKA
jgi:hypothetical protein